MNILITSASRKVWLVNAFKEALAKENGGKVIAIDVSPFAPALYHADEYFLVSRSDAPDFINRMVELCRRHEIAIVIPTRDEELQIFADNKKLFESIGTKVMIAEPEVIRICRDKKRFIQFCQDNGLLTPKTYSTNELYSVPFPLFVKPRFGKGGRSALKVDSTKDLNAFATDDMIVQEFVDATEYTVDIFADFEGRIISVVPRERNYVFCGESFISTTSKNPLLIREASRLASKLGLVGHNTIQCFLEREEVKFIEVNPRFGGAAHLSFCAGAPTPQFLVRLLAGKEVKPTIGDFRDRLVMMRYTTDMFVDEDDLAKKAFK